MAAAGGDRRLTDVWNWLDFRRLLKSAFPPEAAQRRSYLGSLPGGPRSRARYYTIREPFGTWLGR
jgi:hypothetical protein